MLTLLFYKCEKLLFFFIKLENEAEQVGVSFTQNVPNCGVRMGWGRGNADHAVL